MQPIKKGASGKKIFDWRAERFTNKSVYRTTKMYIPRGMGRGISLGELSRFRSAPDGGDSKIAEKEIFQGNSACLPPDFLERRNGSHFIAPQWRRRMNP
jgi:hypothetical protein